MGLCGFSCFAYWQYRCIAYVLDDCFTVFHRNPQLYIQQTEFGKKQSNLSHYCRNLRLAVANIRTQSVPSILWLEDAHLTAYAMLYDIAVFIYNGISSRWVVYNETGSQGYICLYFTGSHFDVTVADLMWKSSFQDIQRFQMDDVPGPSRVVHRCQTPLDFFKLFFFCMETVCFANQLVLLSVSFNWFSCCWTAMQIL